MCALSGTVDYASRTCYWNLEFAMYIRNLLMFLVLMASEAVGQNVENIVTNGGFELEGTEGAGDAADWIEFGTVGTGVFVRDPTMPATGEWAFRLETTGNCGCGPANVVHDGRFVGLPSLLPASTVSLSFDVNYEQGDGTLGYIFSLRRDGGDLIESVVNPILDTGGSYVTITGPTFQVPEGLEPFPGNTGVYFYTAIEFYMNSTSNRPNFELAFIDNVRIEGTFVPEPKFSFLMIPILSAVMLRRRRRFSK